MKSNKSNKTETSILGIVTVNDKGQVVIPVEARESIGLSSGDRLMVMINPHHDGVVLIKPDRLEHLANHMLEQLSSARHIKS